MSETTRTSPTTSGHSLDGFPQDESGISDRGIVLPEYLDLYDEDLSSKEQAELAAFVARMLSPGSKGRRARSGWGEKGVVDADGRCTACGCECQTQAKIEASAKAALEARFRAAEAEAAQEEAIDKATTAERKKEELERQLREIRQESAGAGREVELLERELEHCRKERDDAIGQRFMLEKEAREVREERDGLWRQVELERADEDGLSKRETMQLLIKSKLIVAQKNEELDDLQARYQQREKELIQAHQALALFNIRQNTRRRPSTSLLV